MESRRKIMAAGGLAVLAALWAATGPRPGGEGRPWGAAARPAAAPGLPEPPSVYLDTRLTPPAGREIMVAGGSAEGARDFQAALEQARPGDVIRLEAGATFTGNFVLPPKPGAEWIVVRSSAGDESLPPPGARVTPEHAAAMPKVVSPNAGAALRTAPGAHHYRLIGIELGVSPNVPTNRGIVQLGDGGRPQTSLETVPHDLIIDRCYIHGNAQGDVSRGVALNSARTSVIDSYIASCHGVGFDTQAIAGWNGPGPFKILNNYLEGAGENVMFGGADPTIAGLVPSDIEFRGNHCFKPLAWKPGDPSYAGTRWTVKNIFELKSARRVLVEGNVFEHNWVGAQNGFAVLFTVRNQDGGAPWSVVEDVTFTNNIVRRTAAAINILGRDDKHPSRQAGRILIRNNLFADVGGARWGGAGHFLQLTDAAAVTVDHNTVLQAGSLVTAYGKPNPNFVFTNNLGLHNEYGVVGDGVGPGWPALRRYFPGLVFRRNVIVGGRASLYPPDNFFPAGLELVRLVDRGGAPGLAAASRYRGGGTDEKDIGWDVAASKRGVAAVAGREVGGGRRPE